MISINLHQPGIINNTISFPGEWDELLPDEVLQICQLQLAGLPLEQTKASMLCYLLANRARVNNHKLPPEFAMKLDPEQLAIDGLPLVDFIYKENTLTKPAENCIKLSGTISTTLYAPLAAFENLTCGEFEDCENCVNEFFDQPGGLPLANLTAILYRPKNQPYVWLEKKTGLYASYDYKRRVSKVSKLQANRLYAVFVWYIGCRGMLQKLFPNVYGGGNSNAEKDPMAFTKCIHAGAGPKNGTRYEIRMMKLLEFLYDMEQEAIKEKELKALYEQRK